MLFGEYLIQKKLATYDDITGALQIQKKSRLPVGKIAVSLEFLFAEDAEKIHALQSGMGKLFGESGVRLGLLSEKQVKTLLDIQRRLYLPVGKIVSMEKEYWKEA